MKTEIRKIVTHHNINDGECMTVGLSCENFLPKFLGKVVRSTEENVDLIEFHHSTERLWYGVRYTDAVKILIEKGCRV